MSHSLIIHGNNDYLASTRLAFYFYTRSRSITKRSQYIKYSDDPESESKMDYIRDRTELIVNNTPRNSIVFIDGPLNGGQASHYTIELNNELLKKDINPAINNKMNTTSVKL